MAETTIEWADRVWNPVLGCTRVSPGCDHCYAAVMAKRLRAMGKPGYQDVVDDAGNWTGTMALQRHKLEEPLRVKKPARWFVNSMSDLFHKDIPDRFIAEVWDVMRAADRHTFMVLTKRPQRLARMALALSWPANIWVGTSVELYQYRWRLDHLRRVPAAVRFLSAEPLLGPLWGMDLSGIDWVIGGGESGPGHRPCDPEWMRALRDDTRGAGGAFLLKQWGGARPTAGGRMLDDVLHDDYPTPVLR